MRMPFWSSSAGLLIALSPVVAQEPGRPQPPQVVTSASGEVRIAPDKANLMIGVQSRAATAADASAQNSRKQRAIIDAIKARGIPAEQIATAGFNVIPETRYDREGQGPPRTTSYLVTNSVNVEIRRIELVGPIIDAALSNGANEIGGLSFSASAADSARRAALAIAVAKARADAEAMARAAGGSLGTLIELISTEQYQPPRPMMAMARVAGQADAGVPVEPGQETIRAGVQTRWLFLPGPPR